MKNIFNFNKRTNERGATMVEYALMAALIGSVVIVGATKFGKDLAEGSKKTGETMEHTAMEANRMIGVTVDKDENHAKISGGQGVEMRCLSKYGVADCLDTTTGKIKPRCSETVKQNCITPSTNPCDYIMSGKCRTNTTPPQCRCATFSKGVRTIVDCDC